NEFFSAAEKLLMEDAVFIILWYGEDLALEQSFVRDFETNGIGYIDLKKVYFKTPTAAEYASN
ncbi:MAG: oligopeptide transport system substrate-binding protein, partial [Crocinitomix sp.]